ncbi:MAG: hypothetical protein V1908_02855 [Candidatus Peregrinibacteria bacterium]
MKKIISLGIVTNARALDPEDTFFLFANEAIARPYLRVYTFDVEDVDLKRGVVHAKRITSPISYTTRRTLLKKNEALPLVNFNGLFLKKDPPLDANFLRFLKFLNHKRIPTVNSPQGILTMGTKAYLKHFSSITPKTSYVHRVSQALKAIRSLKNCVVKQSDSYGGQGVTHVSYEAGQYYFYHGSRRRPIALTRISHQIKKALSQSRDHTLLVVRYLPSAPVRGDRRVVVLGGRILGVYIRLPDPKKGVCVCANQGAKRCNPTAQDRAIVRIIKPHLKKHGIVLAALDLLADDSGRECLSEINVVNPGFLSLHKTHPEYNVAKQVIDSVERQLH